MKEEIEILINNLETILKNFNNLKDSNEYVGVYISKNYFYEMETILKDTLESIKEDN